QKKLAAAVADAKAAALAARQRRELAREIKAWQTVLRHSPDDADARRALAEAQHPDRVREEVKRLYQLGIDQYTKDKVDQALATWKQAQELDPNNEQIRKAIERAEARLGEEKLRGK